VRGALVLVLQMIQLTGPLRSPSLPEYEVRAPLRFGVAWMPGREGVMQTTSVMASYDAARLSSKLMLTLDAEIEDRRGAAFAITSHGGGLGIHYGEGESQVASSFDVVTSADWDGTAFVGGAVSLRASIQPFYITVKDAVRCRHGAARSFIASSLAVWAAVRFDWGGAAGVTFSFGASVDLTHLVIAPAWITLEGAFSRCSP
jgi:hypothetical protein